MTTATVPEIAAILTTSDALTLSQVRQIRRVAEQNAYDRQALIEAYKAEVGSDKVRQAALAYALDFAGDVDDLLSGSNDPMAKALLGLAYLAIDEYDDGVKLLKAAASKREDAKVELVRAYLDAEDLDAPPKPWSKNSPTVSTLTLCAVASKNPSATPSAPFPSFESALEQDTEHVDAAFVGCVARPHW